MKPPRVLKPAHVRVLRAARSSPIRVGLNDNDNTVYRFRGEKLPGWPVEEMIACRYLERGQVEGDHRALTLTPEGEDRLASLPSTGLS